MHDHSGGCNRRTSFSAATLFLLTLPVAFAACRLRIETSPGAPIDAAETVPAETACAVHEVNVVAHFDDDLLFMNPAIDNAIDSSHCVRTVYLTAGDAGLESSYVVEREAGVRAAYAVMAAVPDEWARADLTVGGRTVRSLTLTHARQVTLSFLNLPDGIDGRGSDRYGHVSLGRLWRGVASDLTTIDGATRYDRQSVIDVLSDILLHDRADIVRTLDRTGVWGRDHSDHRNSARFAVAAFERSGLQAVHTSYRGYNIDELIPNLDEAAVHAKWEAFAAYVAHDPALANGHDPVVSTLYVSWAARQYPLTARETEANAFIDSSGRCLSATADEPSAAELRVVECGDGLRQAWLFTDDGQLRNEGRCVTARGDLAFPDTPVLGTACKHVPPQHWKLTPEHHIIAMGRCLASHRDGTMPELAECSNAPEQVWRAAR